MLWFLERINTRTLPIVFGVGSKQEYPADFARLRKAGVLKRNANLSEVACSHCQSEQLWQVLDERNEIFYICQDGCGKVPLTDDDVVIFEYDNNAFLKLISNDFGIKTSGDTFSEVSEHTRDAFYQLGTYEDKTLKAEVYYLRTDAVYEPSSLFEHLGNGTKVLITNTTKPTMVWGKEGTRYCVLVDVLSSSNKHIFDAAKFKKCLEGVRRVRFDTKQGHLLLDESRVYTAGLNSPEYHFLLCLWERWQKQVPHGDIHHFVKDALGRDVADTAQKFCNKMKNNIKNGYAGIGAIITVPTTRHYMMADPV